MIVSEKHLYNCIRYIYNNPVKAKIVTNPEQYKYSNYNYFDNNNLNEKLLSFKQSGDIEYVKNEEDKILDVKEDELDYARSIINTYKKDCHKNIAKETTIIYNVKVKFVYIVKIK